ncbi:MAG: hypothetical protein IJ815_07015 [Lachnospiraceae bacterium]|nr:hypothetical protein [Lachnospiraceae bacterium]
MAKPHSLGKKDARTPVSKPVEKSYLNKTPLWSFKKLDIAYHKWQVEDTKELLTKLKDFEGLTWQEIETASGGKKKGHGSNSHSIPIYNLINEAQKRLSDINLGAEDYIFSLRINAKTRLWGFRRDEVLEIIWYDKEHEICKSGE